MNNNLWMILALYLIVGVLWGAFAAGKGLELGYYSKENPYVSTVTVIANTLAWPIAIPIGIYRLMTD